MSYLSLPLSPGQRSSCLAGVSVGSSFQQLLLSFSDPAQCAGREPKHPVTDMHKQNKGDMRSIMGFRKTALCTLRLVGTFSTIYYNYVIYYMQASTNSQLSVHLYSSAKPPQIV